MAESLSTHNHHDDYTPDTVPDEAPLAPLGTVISNINVELGAFISFQASVRGAVVDTKSEGFKNLHQHEDGSVTPVRQQYLCPVCEATSGFVKGRAKGESYVVIPPEVIAAHSGADAAHDKRLTLSIHPAAEVTHALPNGKVYYLSPGKKTNSNYANLAGLMNLRRDVAFVGVMAMRGVAYRYLLTSDGITVSLNQLADPDLVRARPQASVAPDASIAGYSALIDTMITPFAPQQRTSSRLSIVEDYVATAEAAPVLSAQEELAAPSVQVQNELAATASKLGIVLPFPMAS